MLKWLLGFVVGFGLWLIAPTAGAESLTCPRSIDGEIISPGDAKMSGKLASGFGASSCNTPASAPPVVSGSNYGYDAYTFKNRSAQTCVNVTLTATGNRGLYAAAYQSSFDPQNITANFIGSVGMATDPGGGSRAFSFDVPQFQDFVIVINETADGEGGKYRVDVQGCGDIGVSEISPSFGPSAGGTTVQIRGAGFVNGTTVLFGGTTSSATTVIDEFTLLVPTPAYANGGVSPHSVDVTVVNPNGSRVTTARGFTYFDMATSETAIVSSRNPAVVGKVIVFTAQVRPMNPQAATGSITFLDGTVVLGVAALDATGKATFSTSSLQAGYHSIEASYAGNEFLFGSSATLTQRVTKR